MKKLLGILLLVITFDAHADSTLTGAAVGSPLTGAVTGSSVQTYCFRNPKLTREQCVREFDIIKDYPPSWGKHLRECTDKGNSFEKCMVQPKSHHWSIMHVILFFAAVCIGVVIFVCGADIILYTAHDYRNRSKS
jgi:hypothetical protein